MKKSLTNVESRHMIGHNNLIAETIEEEEYP